MAPRALRFAIAVVLFAPLAIVTGAGSAARAERPDPSLQAQPAGANRFQGVVTIEGQPAAAGTTVRALIGDRVCGTSRTGDGGRYTLDVAPQSETASCGREGARVQFVVVPGFGSG